MMTADCPTDFPYEPAPVKDDPETLRKYWGIAKGLQAVDRLRPSKLLEQLAQDTIEGSRTLAESGEEVRRYYLDPTGEGEVERRFSKAEIAGSNTDDASDTKEADLVAQRITEMLTQGAFLFAPEMLSRIHQYLFQDLDPMIYKPGRFKDELLVKRESILNGDSVLYTNPTLVEASLRIAFEDEIEHEYEATFDETALENLAQFVARIWQVHPFVEGNTRTIAVFTVLYLNDLGYDITNEPFEHHARYFRDALVRATYRNPKANVFPELAFLVRFLNGILGETNKETVSFDSHTLRIPALFEDPSLLRNVTQ